MKGAYGTDECCRIGILGGTFDPIHIGHLILAQEACDALGLSQVLFVPAGDPPHKRGRLLSPAWQRVQMVKLAIADNPSFALSRVDVDRPGPHFTTDMVCLIQEQLNPQARPFFLMGMDSLVDFPNWHEPEKLLELCTLVALSRPGYPVNWESLEEALPRLRGNMIRLPIPELEISSHDLQQRVREGRPIRYQVLPQIEVFIREHKLYQSQ